MDAGLRSLFVGFETLNPDNLVEQRKYQNMNRDYAAAVRRLHDLGVMINGSFVFGMDGDDAVGLRPHRRVGDRPGHRDRHLPHPHALSRHGAVQAHGGARGASPRPIGTSTTRATPCSARRACPATQLEQGYWRAYREFYTWRNIARGAAAHGSLVAGLRHFAYAAGWKKFEPLWDLVIRAKQAGAMLPVLEGILSEFGQRATPWPGADTRAYPHPPAQWARVFRPASSSRSSLPPYPPCPPHRREAPPQGSSH